jgi:hypothetical protein
MVALTVEFVLLATPKLRNTSELRSIAIRIAVILKYKNIWFNIRCNVVFLNMVGRKMYLLLDRLALLIVHQMCVAPTIVGVFIIFKWRYKDKEVFKSYIYHYGNNWNYGLPEPYTVYGGNGLCTDWYLWTKLNSFTTKAPVILNYVNILLQIFSIIPITMDSSGLKWKVFLHVIFFDFFKFKIKCIYGRL